MGDDGRTDYRARERERQRRQRGRQAPDKASKPAEAAADPADRRRAATTCAWCGRPITPRSRGPIPKWCSATCRHRAWEQTRAATSGLVAIDVIERQVEVRVLAAPSRRDWPRLLAELARQLADGRIYDRDLPHLSHAIDPVLDAYRRRLHLRNR
jgi:hypothetical protein